MLDLDDQHAREVRRRSSPCRTVGVLLLDAVVAVQLEALAVIRLQVRIGRLLAEAARIVCGKWPWLIDQRIARVRVLVEAFGQQHVRAEVHRPAPELRQALALDALVLDVLRRRRIGDRRDHLVERDRDRRVRAGSIVICTRRAVEIARRAVPLLPLAAIHRQLDDVAVGAAERLVAVEQRLHAVARRAARRAGGAPDSRGPRRRWSRLARLPAVDVDAEDLLRLRAGLDLEARLAPVSVEISSSRRPSTGRRRAGASCTVTDGAAAGPGSERRERGHSQDRHHWHETTHADRPFRPGAIDATARRSPCGRPGRGCGARPTPGGGGRRSRAARRALREGRILADAPLEGPRAGSFASISAATVSAT